MVFQLLNRKLYLMNEAKGGRAAMNQEYQVRMERVMAYIEENLASSLQLEKLAEVANFSKYHFSRIFTHTIGVTPAVYVNQRRLQKSIAYLTETDKTILEIAALCGFESISTFNTSFKKYFQDTPRAIREKSKDRNFSSQGSKNREEFPSPLRYDTSNNKTFLRRIWEMNIAIKELSSYRVAFVRHVGSYLDTHHAWGQLGSWAARHQLFPPEQSFLGISLDDPSVVEEYACRYDACVTLPDGFDQDAHPEMQFKTLPGGLYALYQFYDTIEKFGITYQSIYGQWLPNSEYDPDDRHCLEFMMNNPAEDPEGKCKVDLYIPIRKRD